MSDVLRISTGCTLLDCDLGYGGIGLGRVFAITGLESTGKTQVAIEAMVNFAKQYPTGRIFYCDSEQAFSEDYAAILGLNVDEQIPGPPDKDGERKMIPRITFLEDVVTVEDFFRAVEAALDGTPDEDPAICILDSLDMLTSESEQATDIAAGSYNASKAKKMSETFRRLIAKMRKKNMTLFLVCQLRDKFNSMGPNDKYMMTGGHAVAYMMSQLVVLTRKDGVYRTIDGEKKEIGVLIEYKIKKNKLGSPGAKGTFKIEYRYGIADLAANIDWLAKHGYLDKVPGAENYKTINGFMQYLDRKNGAEMAKAAEDIRLTTIKCHRELSEKFYPTRGKYDLGEDETGDEDVVDVVSPISVAKKMEAKAKKEKEAKVGIPKTVDTV